jgi:PAS domain-containing protein
MTKNPLWTILDASPVGIAVFDADEFIIYANPMAEALLGTSVAKADRLRTNDSPQAPVTRRPRFDANDERIYTTKYIFGICFGGYHGNRQAFYQWSQPGR